MVNYRVTWESSPSNINQSKYGLVLIISQHLVFSGYSEGSLTPRQTVALKEAKMHFK